MKFAYAVGRFNTRVLLTIVYFIVLGVPALLVKLMRKDLLDRKIETSKSSYWNAKERTPHSLENARHQF